MNKFPSKIFIDGGDPLETAEAKKLLGHLDGQTTNPTLIAKNLKAREEGRITNHELRITEDLALEEYKKIVQAMNHTIPDGSISIQVFADFETKAEEMLKQARDRNTWIPNASIKFPCIPEGLKAAEIACKEMPVNITLVFSQSQAAAVYEATKGAQYPVFISPFVGRLDDIGQNGMDVIKNIITMYKTGDGHVEVLTASTRSVGHVLYALKLRSNIITIPFKVIKLWKEEGLKIPDENYKYDTKDFKPILYDDRLVLGKKWDSYDLTHALTDKGVASFYSDWTGLFV